MIGKRIKILREELGLKQDELAKQLSVSPSAIGMYERNLREPNNELTLKFADFFKVSIDYLLGKTDIRNPGEQIDDVLNEAMIGMSKKDYEKLTETQKKQIRDFAIFVKNQNQGENRKYKNIWLANRGC